MINKIKQFFKNLNKRKFKTRIRYAFNSFYDPSKIYYYIEYCDYYYFPIWYRLKIYFAAARDYIEIFELDVAEKYLNNLNSLDKINLFMSKEKKLEENDKKEKRDIAKSKFYIKEVTNKIEN